MKKYLVLLSNYNVIGRIYLTGVIGLRNGKTRLFFVLWETYSWFWLFSMEPKQDILWLKGCFFPLFSPQQKSPLSASQHPFYRLPFSHFLLLLPKKWQRKSEELNSIQTALQIWDFQATSVWSSSVFVTQMMNVLKLKSSRSDLFFSVCDQHTHTEHVVWDLYL